MGRSLSAWPFGPRPRTAPWLRRRAPSSRTMLEDRVMILTDHHHRSQDLMCPEASVSLLQWWLLQESFAEVDFPAHAAVFRDLAVQSDRISFVWILICFAIAVCWSREGSFG